MEEKEKNREEEESEFGKGIRGMESGKTEQERDLRSQHVLYMCEIAGGKEAMYVPFC